MATLPRCRSPITYTPYPFVNSVDAFVPLFIVNRKRTEKPYSLIFFCLVTRASSFGHLSRLDNGLLHQRFPTLHCQKRTAAVPSLRQWKHFVGARRELQEALNAGIRTSLQTPPQAPEMEWHLNPPFAPHFGREWERLIQTTKKTLLLILVCRKLIVELFYTILAETDLMLNSQTLTHVADYPDNEEPLMPNHFLGKSWNEVLQKSWKEIQNLVKNIWERLLTEYILTQYHRSKWNIQLPPVAFGELVWLIRDFTPRGI